MRLPVVFAVLAMAAACSPQGAPGKADSADGAATATAGPADPTGFSHPADADLYGFYTAATPPKVGNWQLSNFHIGDEVAFKAWEKGERLPTYAPVMLEFDDLTSPTQTNELGAEFHTGSERILPTAYLIAPDGRIDFVGTGAKLGKVTFHGRLDLARLKTITDAQSSPNSPPEGFDADATVMTGALTVGGQTFENVTFSWYGGD
ncbi:MAG: hypothetical protein K1X35_00275 [Caulobacteraceae bacterium]|nr:hypothetical protein [Caulobacteraceae bacterium]